MGRMLIGLSLSNCIRDIIEYRVRENEVMFIIAGTNWGLHDPHRIVKAYEDSYWKTDPVWALRVLNWLIDGGKIIQPRQHGYQPPNIAHGHWALQIRP